MSLNVYNQHWENAEYQAQVPFSPFLPLGHSHQANMEAAKLSEDVCEPPHLTWSTAMFRKRRTENGEQATEAGRDCLEVKAS